MRWRTLVLVGACLGAAYSTAAAAPPGASFSRSRPVNWVSVAPGQPARVWAENVSGGWLSKDGGRTFEAPLSTSAFRRAQVAQAAFLADGKTLLGMPTVWSTQQFTPPLWSADGGVTWRTGALRGPDVRYDFGAKLRFVGESPVTPDPDDARTAWFCQGNLYVTHDAGRNWSVSRPYLKRPWHCSALAIAPRDPHTLLLLAQSGRNTRRTPGRLLRSVNGGATWRRVKAPHYPEFDYNGHSLAFDPAKPSEALMLGAAGFSLGALYHSQDAGLTWKRVRPAGLLRGAVVDQFAFASDGRALAIVRIRGRQNLMFSSSDGGRHWTAAPVLPLDSANPAVYSSPLAVSGTSFLLGTNRRGFWRLAKDARLWARP